MKYIKSILFICSLSLFSCSSENETTTEKIKEEPSVFDVTRDFLKGINDLNKASEDAKKLLKSIDSSIEKSKDFNKIQPVYFDSNSNEDTSGLKVIIADGR